jgi:thioredoxin 1
MDLEYYFIGNEMINMAAVDESFYSPERDQYLAKLLADNVVLLPEGVVQIRTAAQFNELVTTWKKNLILVTVTSPGCPACKAFAPIYERAQKEFGSKGVIFAQFDATELPGIAQQFGIMGTPTTLFIKNQKLLQRQTGLIPSEPLRQLIKRLQGRDGSDENNLYI